MKINRSPSLSTAPALIIVMVMLLVYMSIGHAGQDEVPDITMSVLESEVGAELTIPEIPLPEKATLTARENSAKGRGIAKEARDRGHEFGQDRAEQARDRDKKKSDRPGKPDKPGRPDND